MTGKLRKAKIEAVGDGLQEVDMSSEEDANAIVDDNQVKALKYKGQYYDMSPFYMQGGIYRGFTATATATATATDLRKRRKRK